MNYRDIAARVVSRSGSSDYGYFAILKRAAHDATEDPSGGDGSDFRQFATGTQASVADGPPKVKSDADQGRHRKSCRRTCVAEEAGSCDGLGFPFGLFGAADDAEIDIERVKTVEAGRAAESSAQAVINLLTDVALRPQPGLDLTVHQQVREVSPTFGRKLLQQVQALANVALQNAIGSGMASADEALDGLSPSAGQFGVDLVAILTAQPGEGGISCFGNYLRIGVSADQISGKRAVEAIDGAGKPRPYQIEKRFVLARFSVDGLSNRPAAANQLAEFLDGDRHQASALRTLSAVELGRRQRIGDVSLYTLESLTSDEVDARRVDKHDVVAADVEDFTQVFSGMPDLSSTMRFGQIGSKAAARVAASTMPCNERYGFLLNSAGSTETDSDMGSGHDVDAKTVQMRHTFEGGGPRGLFRCSRVFSR